MLGSALGLALAVAGCHSVPPAPTGGAVRPDLPSASSGGGYDDDSGGGWLFDRLRGRSPAASEVARPSDSGVQQTSAVQPLPSADGLNEASAIPVLDADAFDEDDGPKKKDEKSGFDLADLAPDRVYENLKAAAGFGADKGIAKQYYQEGWALYQQKRYREAAVKFRAAAGRWPDSSLEENALFMASESHFFADEYSKSFDTLCNLLKKHDNTRHLDKVSRRLFDIAKYWDDLHEAEPHWPVTPNLNDAGRPRFDTLGNARKAYEMVTLHDPTGPLADDALMALGNSYFRKGRFEEAAFQYDRLRKEYPNSAHIVEAHLLGMKSKEQVYQGAMYDRKPLEEASEIADQALRQFGHQLGEERANVVHARNRFEAKMAERDWQMAKFYEVRRQYGAAKYYYRQILKDYPGGEMARAAQARLAEIKDYPDKPPNRFKFLTDLFPDDR